MRKDWVVWLANLGGKNFYIVLGIVFIIMMVVSRAMWRSMALMTIGVGYWEFSFIHEVFTYVCVAGVIAAMIFGSIFEVEDDEGDE